MKNTRNEKSNMFFKDFTKVFVYDFLQLKPRYTFCGIGKVINSHEFRFSFSAINFIWYCTLGFISKTATIF